MYNTSTLSFFWSSILSEITYITTEKIFKVLVKNGVGIPILLIVRELVNEVSHVGKPGI